MALIASACGFTHGAVGSVASEDDGPPGDATFDTATDDSITLLDARSPAVPALVHEISAFANNSNAPLSATLPALPAAGHLLVMIGAAEHGGLTSVSGGGVATWTRATQSLSNVNIEIWYGVTNGSSATITIAFPAYSLPMWMDVSEWSGLAVSNILDGAVSKSGATSPATAGSLSASANDLVLFAVGDSKPNTFGTPTQGTWTDMITVTTNATTQTAWYRFAAAAGTVNPGVTESAHSWDAAVAAFRTP